MQTFRPFHSAPRKGLTNAVLGRMMGHAIICLAVAGFVLCDSSRSSVWADQPAWELTQDEALLDEPALERSTIQFCLTENAAPADAGEHTPWPGDRLHDHASQIRLSGGRGTDPIALVSQTGSSSRRGRKTDPALLSR